MVENSTEIELLYRQHGPALLLFASAHLGQRAAAQDTLHFVFLRLMESDALRRVEDKKAYLFACIRNAVLNERRFRSRNTPLFPEADWFVAPNQDRGAELDLRRALWALPQDQREVVVLHIWGDLTFAQIGKLTGVGVNTAASRYRYALAKLRETMCTKESSCAEFGR